MEQLRHEAFEGSRRKKKGDIKLFTKKTCLIILVKLSVLCAFVVQLQKEVAGSALNKVVQYEGATSMVIEAGCKKSTRLFYCLAPKKI